MLTHLTLVPTGGLCNRLRAIASARRLCAAVGARCTIVWDWGDFAALFRLQPDFSITRSVEAASEVTIRHYLSRAGVTTVDTTMSTIEVHSGVAFHGSHEVVSGSFWRMLLPFMPAPNAAIARRVEDVAGKLRLADCVGMHIRRTDHGPARKFSPDELFIERAIKVVEGGARIFLSTDNLETERLFRTTLGADVVISDKQRQLEARWPRDYDPVASEEDLVDLHLLSKTRYVLGSFHSSFTKIAIALNGSPQSTILRRSPTAQERAAGMFIGNFVRFFRALRLRLAGFLIRNHPAAWGLLRTIIIFNAHERTLLRLDDLKGMRRRARGV